MTDPFAHSDAAYVLGALDAAERHEFEAHLTTCPDCQSRVAEARDTVGLLAALPPSAVDEVAAAAEPVPDTLLPSLLRSARRERARRRWFTAGVGAIAAACLVALAIVLWPGGGSSNSRPAPQAFTAVRPSPVSATAQLVSRDWGTEIDLRCTYPASDDYRFAYRLVVVDRSDNSHPAGDWSLVPGRGDITFTGGTSVPKDQIASLQITTATGVPVLQLRR